MKRNAFLIFIISIACFQIESIAQIGVNTATPDQTSILDLSTEERGLLIPRMTTQRRLDIINQIGPPAEGLLVYDTDEEMFYFYNPNNGDGNNTNGDENWQAVNPLKYVDTQDNLQGSEYLRKLESHPSVQDISFFENTPGSAIPPRLYVDGQVTIGASNVAPDEPRGLYVDEKVQVTDDLEVEGTVTANRFNGFGTIPIGGIIMWSGTTPPSGWAICDGNNGTPDLSGRFIMGYGGGLSVGSTGGQSSTSLTVANLPSHSHSKGTLGGTTTVNGNHTHSTNASNHYDDDSGGDDLNAGGDGVARRATAFSNGNHSHTLEITGSTGDTGSGTSFENRPPYYVLAFIQRKQ